MGSPAGLSTVQESAHPLFVNQYAAVYDKDASEERIPDKPENTEYEIRDHGVDGPPTGSGIHRLAAGIVFAPVPGTGITAIGSPTSSIPAP